MALNTYKTASKSLRKAEISDASVTGLKGKFDRPIKLTFLGAGSFFSLPLLNDILRIPGNCGGTIVLVDTDARRLSGTVRAIRKLIEYLNLRNWKLVASTDRWAVLKDSNYVVNCIEVSGVDCVRMDNDIPLKYGIDQCIGDTVGPGGLFKALRTIPVWLDVLRDCERLCPEALVLNYTNPMSMLCLAAARVSSMQVIGLCHSVQHTSNLLAQYAGVPYEELEWNCAGVNHLAWFVKLRHKGNDLYPKLHKKFATEISEGIREFDAGLVVQDSTDNSHGRTKETKYKQTDLIRKDMCLHFGAFITESSGHISEYLPYYRKSTAGRKLLRLGYDGGSRFYASNWPRWRSDADSERAALLRSKAPLEWVRTWEYASWIIEAREKDSPIRVHGNVLNNSRGAGQLITNLPADGCVEVACYVDRNGVNPSRFGSLPPQMAAVSASNMMMIDLGAQAAVERDIGKAIYSLMLDPLTAAVCTPTEIKKMTLELFKAEKRFLPRYK